MECRINDVAVHYAEQGTGLPLVALHGSSVDHRELQAAVEAIVPRSGYRRIYPDLPSTGPSTAGVLSSNDQVVALLGDFINRTAGVNRQVTRTSQPRRADGANYARPHGPGR